jgi:hypothetical protein
MIRCGCGGELLTRDHLVATEDGQDAHIAAQMRDDELFCEREHLMVRPLWSDLVEQFTLRFHDSGQLAEEGA